MFSVFMDLVVPNILNLKDIENLYIEVQENQYNVKPDVFSYVLYQKLDDTYQTVHCGFKGGWRKPGISLGAITIEHYQLDKPSTKIKFLDTEFNTVSDIESYLLKVYGEDWRIPINKKGNYT